MEKFTHSRKIRALKGDRSRLFSRQIFLAWPYNILCILTGETARFGMSPVVLEILLYHLNVIAVIRRHDRFYVISETTLPAPVCPRPRIAPRANLCAPPVAARGPRTLARFTVFGAPAFNFQNCRQTSGLMDHHLGRMGNTATGTSTCTNLAISLLLSNRWSLPTSGVPGLILAGPMGPKPGVPLLGKLATKRPRYSILTLVIKCVLSAPHAE